MEEMSSMSRERMKQQISSSTNSQTALFKKELIYPCGYMGIEVRLHGLLHVASHVRLGDGYTHSPIASGSTQTNHAAIVVDARSAWKEQRPETLCPLGKQLTVNCLSCRMWRQSDTRHKCKECLPGAQGTIVSDKSWKELLLGMNAIYLPIHVQIDVKCRTLNDFLYALMMRRWKDLWAVREQEKLNHFA